ncbi:MAG: prephenate dehydrogenase [Rikenellaceae bacterium]|jgi:prephenate dehydrogenase|nr:prephenate dehydrogenase [Rikenellaceae bacterium]
MKTAIIGTGLIGGSLALSMRNRGLGGEIWGVDASAEHIQTAIDREIIDRGATMDEAVAGCDLIIIATPVDTVPALAVKLLNKVGDKQVVMDVGSVKGELCEMISQHPRRGRFVASHPMWGTEHSGPAAAVDTGFIGRVAVICEPERSEPDALKMVEELYTAIGMKVRHMSAEEHDIHTAYISHVSHISSFALALTVLEKELEEDTIFDLAAGGFDSTVRLAKSSPRMWLPIFMQNKYNVLDVLRELIHQLHVMQRMIERDDTAGLQAAMEKANSIKRILK